MQPMRIAGKHATSANGGKHATGANGGKTRESQVMIGFGFAADRLELVAWWMKNKNACT